MSMHGLIVEARLRARNQLTLPDAVVQAGGISKGERFAVSFDPDDPDTIRFHRIRTSYAGSLPDAYGPTETYLDEVREGWR